LIVFFELVILSSEILINIHKVINLLIKYINISEKVIILFFSLDKCVLNLLNICEACCLFYCIESLIDNLHISLVIIDKFHFFLIIDNKFSKAIF
jgi:hypothetical protein